MGACRKKFVENREKEYVNYLQKRLENIFQTGINDIRLPDGDVDLVEVLTNELVMIHDLIKEETEKWNI